MSYLPTVKRLNFFNYIYIFLVFIVILILGFYLSSLLVTSPNSIDSEYAVRAQVWQCEPGATRCNGDTRERCETDGCNGDFSCWKSQNIEQRWCDADETEHICQNGVSTSTGVCCGPNCNGNGGGNNPPSGRVYVSNRGGASATVCNTNPNEVTVNVAECQKNYTEPKNCSEVKYEARCQAQPKKIPAGSEENPSCKTFSVGIPACGVWQLDISYNGTSLYGESDCNFNNCAPTPPPTPQQPTYKCVGLTGWAYKNSPNEKVSLDNLPKGFNGKVRLECTGFTSDKNYPITEITFMFAKSGQGVQAKKITNFSSPTSCILSGINGATGTKGYCYKGYADFDITGKGTYDATSRVCVEFEGKKLCDGPSLQQ